MAVTKEDTFTAAPSTGLGLSEAEAQLRLAQYGPNLLAEAPRLSRLARFWNQVKSPVVLVLALAALLSLALQEWGDGLAILAILLLNAVMGFVQEQKADDALAALRAMTHPRCKVLREGQIREIPSPSIVPGDYLLLEAGDSVPADARILSSQQCWVDESILTGESLPVEKQASSSDKVMSDDEASATVLYAGTAMARGSAHALVIATGMQSRLGHMATLMQKAERSETPLQTRMAEASAALLWMAGAVILILFGLGWYHQEDWKSLIISALSLAVAAIPEGLPAVVTVALAIAVRRMSTRKAIIRHLPSVETLGSCNVICTDKTGTLTTGQMQVREWLLDPLGAPVSCRGSHATLDARQQEALLVATLASTASYSEAHGGAGDTTEIALLQVAHELGVNPSTLQKEQAVAREWSFDSHRKRMSLGRNRDGKAWLYVKGAPESILPLCRLSQAERQALDTQIAAMSRKGQRLLALAERSEGLPNLSQLAELSAEDVERDLTFIGLLALADPPRQESRAAIRDCRKAGIKVVMITGDHPLTAEAIARELELITAHDTAHVVSGPVLAEMSEAELCEQVESIQVYARVSPDDKLRIIEAWKKRGAIVAMTGDGVNDGAALKAASIGIAMGQGGTEVARQAASLVLTDDNFASIVAAIEEGRGVYGNIKRTIFYLLAGNLAEIGLMLGAGFLGLPFPLWPIHLLWINLVTDGLPSLALAAEPQPKGGSLANTRPSPPSFFDKRFYQDILWVGGLVTVLGLFLYQKLLQSHGVEAARTGVFTFVVFEELFRSFAARSERWPFLSFRLPWNGFHWLAVMVPFALQALLLCYPNVFGFFKVVSLPIHEVLGLLAWALIPVSVLEIKKVWNLKTKD